MVKLASTRFEFQRSECSTPRIQAVTQPHPIVRWGLAAMLISALCQLALANANDQLRYQSGVRNSPGEHQLKPKYLEMLIETLRQKTGFLELHFDETGFLRLGDRSKIAGGSATARELLIAAVDRARVIELECHDHSRQVAFARLANPVSFISHATGAKIDVFPIEIDFRDFIHLRGNKTVLAAFDLGFVLLHELAHAALELHDSINEDDGLGECEEYINRIRYELNLPERQNYVARTFTQRSFPTEKPMQQAELLFAVRDDLQGRKKPQTLNLTWEADLVGAVKQTAIKLPSAASRTQTSSARAQTVSAP